jgi:CheY-like chemotaxis protein
MDRESVLVVDDAPDIRELLSYTLEVEGYTVLQASDGGEALEVAAAHEPAVIVMDMQMPILDGIEATKRLKSERRLRDIPVIAYSAYSRDLLSRDLFTDVVPKPSSLDEILSAISRSRVRRKAGNSCLQEA